MSFDGEMGGVVLPLNPLQLEANRLREIADPLHVRLLDFLAAVLTAELQAALNALTGIPDSVKNVVVKAIPGDPVRFIKTLTRDDFPILALYKPTPSTRIPWVIGQKKRETIWQLDYVLPELEQYQLGTLVGLDNAVDIAIGNALDNGTHAAWANGAPVLEGMSVELLESVDSVGANWKWVDDKTGPDGIHFPAVRAHFRTIELPGQYNANPSPLSSIGITQQLLDEQGTEGSEVVLVQSEVTGLDQ